MSDVPTKIKVKTGSGCIELCYDDGEIHRLSFEFLRVFSPSAEVRGHGPGSEVLQHGKKQVVVKNIEPVGNYAVKFIFSDGHDSGIYSWALLKEFCSNQVGLWNEYLSKLELANKTRLP